MEREDFVVTVGRMDQADKDRAARFVDLCGQTLEDLEAAGPYNRAAIVSGLLTVAAHVAADDVALRPSMAAVYMQSMRDLVHIVGAAGVKAYKSKF